MAGGTVRSSERLVCIKSRGTMGKIKPLKL